MQNIKLFEIMGAEGGCAVVNAIQSFAHLPGGMIYMSVGAKKDHHNHFWQQQEGRRCIKCCASDKLSRDFAASKGDKSKREIQWGVRVVWWAAAIMVRRAAIMVHDDGAREVRAV